MSKELGVDDLAKALGVEKATARVKLRKSNIKVNADNRYSWKSKEELDKVVAKLTAEPKKATPKKAAPKKAVAKKAPAKKVAPKKAPAKAEAASATAGE